MGLSIGTLFPLRLRLWFGRLLFRRDLGDKVVRVSWHRLIKGPCDPTEVEAMQYVAAHTSVPIPKLYKIHTEESGRIYIEMEFVRGQTLSAVLDELSKDQTARIFAQLRQHVSALRALPPPAPGIVSSAFGNPAYDGRIGARFFGPMCVNEFQALARCNLVLEDVHFLGQEVLQVHTAHYETKFTHADLGARNIIVRGDNIAAIVDWAYSGWYPEYWEFTKAHFVIREAAWEENIRTAVPCYEKELAVEEILWHRIPEPGTRTRSCRDGVINKHPGSYPSSAWTKARKDLCLNDLWSLTMKLYPELFF